MKHLTGAPGVEGILVHPADMRSLHSISQGPQGAQDSIGHLVQVDKFIHLRAADDNKEDKETEPGQFLAVLNNERKGQELYDAVKLDWLLQAKDRSEETTDLFNDFVIHHKLEKPREGVRGFKTIEKACDETLSIERDEANQILKQMEEHYGRKHLDAMKPDELFLEY